MQREPSRSAEHGVLDPRELDRLGARLDDITDFAVGTNPYGPCPSVVRAIAGAPFDRYPEARSESARATLARSLGCSADRILLGNGAAELLWTAVTSHAPNKDASALIIEPAFSEFRRACEAARVCVHSCWTREERDFTVDFDAVRDAARRLRPTLCYLCTPQAPSGGAVVARSVATLCLEVPDTTFVIDQSFLSLSERHRDASVVMPDNALCIRSLTKDHALAGLRLGIALGAPERLASMAAATPPWTVSSLAQAAAVAIAESDAFVVRSRRRLLDARRRLQRRIRSMGLASVDTSTPYFLIRVGDASSVRRILLEKHAVHVRDCTSFGLPAHIRVFAKRDKANDRLLEALKAAL